ncbi:hypothetical protein K4749_39445 [Streptomyces sp. TRM72054]|uniref:hypothetical protein n=1 Tax=Streptomyces sp. TRM72054 TaxID=2870562 RepID=UPI001C8B7300|nr:hypothetical protein [Streptomyces sp. TRM72054]MBX9399455.1 hypothetical protein [Streptomyces sp. TRM72054]
MADPQPVCTRGRRDTLGPLQRLLQNQRGAVVAHAVRQETYAVICRSRFRLP